MRRRQRRDHLGVVWAGSRRPLLDPPHHRPGPPRLPLGATTAPAHGGVAARRSGRSPPRRGGPRNGRCIVRRLQRRRWSGAPNRGDVPRRRPRHAAPSGRRRRARLAAWSGVRHRLPRRRGLSPAARVRGAAGRTDRQQARRAPPRRVRWCPSRFSSVTACDRASAHASWHSLSPTPSVPRFGGPRASRFRRRWPRPSPGRASGGRSAHPRRDSRRRSAAS